MIDNSYELGTVKPVLCTGQDRPSGLMGLNGLEKRGVSVGVIGGQSSKLSIDDCRLSAESLAVLLICLPSRRSTTR